MKETDHKVLKMFMMERLLPEYSTIALSQVIQKIGSLLYYAKLQKTANKTFFKWVEKQLQNKSQLKERVKKTLEDIYKADKDLREIEQQLKFGDQVGFIIDKTYSKRQS